ncbi:MAG: CXXX repeat peptide modification system protein [Thermoguttaceae bacterium]|nr:CXXX repeat peptide modification system protein [Thermoguttaceae bacterium]MBQ6615765.1 CXXX repeat peptide modification system protein [Thermoguttaceae bacterium]
MSAEKKLVGKVTPEQKDEIQELFERRNSLKELFLIVPKDNQDLYERVVADMALTQKKFDQWWADRAAEYHWEGRKNGHWEINFDTCEIFLNE